MWGTGNARHSLMAGMPGTDVRGSRECIQSAPINSGFGFPNKAVSINLAPDNVAQGGRR